MEERNIRHLDREGLWLYALRLLGQSAQSTGQVREKLRRRAAQAADVDEVLTRLTNAGYLDDRHEPARLTGRLTIRRKGRFSIGKVDSHESIESEADQRGSGVLDSGP